MYIPHKTRYRRNRLKQKLLVFVFWFAILSLISTFGIFAWFARDLPEPGKLASVSNASSIFYDRDGKVLFEVGKDKNRVPVKLDDISDRMKKATISIEDKNFYKHRGISQLGMIRAFLSIVLRGDIQGGSTITQQLIKNVLLSQQRTASRKIREVILAVLVEKRYTKDEILTMYLNEAPYGGNYWGVGSAAKGYFDKAPQDLNLIESAVLAGLPQRPNYYSPFFGKNESWKSRAKDVLRRMREDGYITRKIEKEAGQEVDKLKFSTPKLAINAPHFVFYVRDLIEKEFGPKILSTGRKVKTTLSVDEQKKAEKIVAEEVKKLRGARVGNGAAVVIDSKTAEILTMVGSYDFNNKKYGNFNATLGLRQPGSAIKPVTYGLALEKGYNASTVLMDLKTTFPVINQPDYIPVNYDEKFRGPIQVRFALGNSINLPAVKMLAMVGLRDFLQKAEDVGLETLAPTQENLNRFGLSITLGGGEVTLLDLTSAYSVFARGGDYIKEQSILEITDHKGKRIFRAKKPASKKAFSKEASFIISHILSDNVARTDAFGANSFLNIPGKTVAVKTGTTNDKRDNWTLGFTNDVTVGVWVGNNDNTPMDERIASGVTGASPIWQKIMIELLKEKYKDGIADKPSKVKALTIDAYLGGLPKEGYPTRSEYYIEGTEPKETSSFYKKLKISKNHNDKLANDIEVKKGEYEEKEFIVITENDPVSTDGKDRWQEAIEEWRKQQGDEKYKYPTETSDTSADAVVVSFRSPSNESTVNSNNVEIDARITSVEKVKNVKIYVNGSEVKNLDGDRDEVKETLNLPDGLYEIKIVAKNEKDKAGESTVKIGVNKPWTNPTPTPTP